MKIHHNTLKRAASHGLNLTHDGTSFIAGNEKTGPLATGTDPKAVLDEAITKLLGNETPKSAKRPAGKKTKKRKARRSDEDGEEGDDDEGRSIIKRVYKTRYKPFKMTCGDEMTKLIAGAICVRTKVLIGGKMKTKLRIDRDKLKALAKANDCWNSGYSKLNVGQQRMNVGNRMRARVRKGLEIRWV